MKTNERGAEHVDLTALPIHRSCLSFFLRLRLQLSARSLNRPHLACAQEVQTLLTCMKVRPAVNPPCVRDGHPFSDLKERMNERLTRLLSRSLARSFFSFFCHRLAQKHGFDASSAQCMKDAKRLSTCMASIGNERKQKDSLHYHLQRLSRIMKRR